MPYSVVDDHPDCSGWAVVKDSDGSLVSGGCHATQGEAQDHLTALNIAEFGDRAEPGEGVLPDAYRPAASEDVPEGRACGNCQFYDESLTQEVDGGVEVWCSLWAAFVRGDFYCDRWQPVMVASGEDYEKKEPPMKRGQMKQVREVRNYGLTDVEVREEDDGAVSFNGYATVFNRNYEVYDSYGMFQERIAPSAFDRTLREEPDVVLVINHAGLPLARTKSGTLRLEPDAIGLRVYAELDPEDPDVRALLPKMRRGDVDEMSFAFRVTDDVWSEDYSEREITQVNLHRGDVSVVTFGANPHTMAMVRAALADESVREQLAADPQVARVLTTSSMQETEAEEVAVVATAKKKKAAEPVVEADDEERSAEDVDWAVTVMARLLETKKVS
jgi:HK97 family phage prohead protease